MIGPGVTLSSGDRDYQISVNSGYSVTINGLAFKQSNIRGNHFIHNYGTLVLEHTTFSSIRKEASHINLLYNDRGELTISNSIISNNYITGSHSALIYNDRGELTISNSSTITNNIGEIYNTGGQMTITSSIIRNMNRNNPDKTSEGSPVAIYNDTDGSLTIRDSTIADNISYFNGGGIFNGGILTISGSTISGNSFLSIPRSDYYQTENGGGITNDIGATLTISNSTIAGNMADHGGGGIANWGTMHMSFCTIYGNSASVGGGIAIFDGSVVASNSIVAGNSLLSGVPPSHPTVTGGLSSKGYNLIQNMQHIISQHKSVPDMSNIAVSRFTPNHDRTVLVDEITKLFDPQGLQTNGGKTMTYKLLSGQDNTANPAVDAVPLTVCHNSANMFTDQRGKPRPDDNEQSCDIGAYETSG